MESTAQDGFLLDPGLIHLNTGTLGAVPRAVHERTVAAMVRYESNPHLQAYRDAPDTVLGEAERERARCAAFLGCAVDELLITHGTADGLGQVAASFDLQPDERILTSGAEHDSGVFCWRWLARRRGGHLDVVPIGHDELDDDAIVQRFSEAMRPGTRLVAVSDVVAWTGQRLPIRRLADLAHDRGALLVVDGAQSIGQVPVDVAALGCDAFAGSGHKWLCGPKGTGLLYVRRDAAQRLSPVAWEDGHRLNNEAMGACALPLVIGLGAAVELLQQRSVEATLARNAALRDQLYDGLRTLPGVVPVGPPRGSAIALLGIRLPEDVVAARLRSVLMTKYRIAIRAVDPKQWNGLRASLHVYNDAAHVDALVAALRCELPG
jgi:selenocysteine lyase/cysteine desulfurase